MEEAKRSHHGLTRSNTFVVDSSQKSIGHVTQNDLGHYYISNPQIVRHNSQKSHNVHHLHHHHHLVHTVSKSKTLPTRHCGNLNLAKCVSTQTVPILQQNGILQQNSNFYQFLRE